MKMRTLLGTSILLSLLATKALASETIDIPEEELARESVLPHFDRPDNIKNRNVVSAKKVEVGIYYGGNFTEPIYNQSKIGLNGGYHFSEDSALMFNFAQWMSGRNSQYVPSIEKQGGTDPYDFNRVPDLKMSLWANYEVTAYYGKISLTKQGVMNLTMYPIFGLGVTQYTNKTYPGLNVGIGQRYYFTHALALRIDLKLQYSGAPNPFLGNNELKSSQPVPPASDFSDKYQLGTILDLGLSYLL